MTLPWDEERVLIGSNELHPHRYCGPSVRMDMLGSCVDSVRHLDAIHNFEVDVAGEVVRRWFHPVRWLGCDYYAECRTGTLYDRQTGKASSRFLKIIGAAK